MAPFYARKDSLNADGFIVKAAVTRYFFPRLLFYKSGEMNVIIRVLFTFPLALCSTVFLHVGLCAAHWMMSDNNAENNLHPYSVPAAHTRVWSHPQCLSSVVLHPCFFFSAMSADRRRAAGASSSLHGALLHHALLPEAAVGGLSHLHLLRQLPLQARLRRVTADLQFFKGERKTPCILPGFSGHLIRALEKMFLNDCLTLMSQSRSSCLTDCRYSIFILNLRGFLRVPLHNFWNVNYPFFWVHESLPTGFWKYEYIFQKLNISVTPV